MTLVLSRILCKLYANEHNRKREKAQATATESQQFLLIFIFSQLFWAPCAVAVRVQRTSILACNLVHPDLVARLASRRAA